MELWYTEKQTPEMGITCKITRTMRTEKTPFQDLAVIDTVQFGPMLVLDGMVMTTEKDEFVYHEMISHVALSTHPNPKKVLVVGGGDGGAIREILKHKSVELAVLAEIDERVIDASREFLPHIAAGLSDPRVRIEVTDGIAYVKDHPGEFDVILIDSTEPVGPAVGLFAREFYQSVYKALTPDGIMVAQSESPFFNQELIQGIQKNLRTVFPIVKLYLANIPTYPSGLWSFSIASKQYDPLNVDPQQIPELGTKYYNKELHRSCFALPNFVQELVKE
ncbi:MAG TPA: polyamine aminopropyltransferase [Bacillota bacterium]|nr:polyamine aminopropyltransferase [Bacillota bacterium]